MVDQKPRGIAESGAADASGHQLTPGDARPYADTDRFGSTVTGDTMPIMLPQNKQADPVWGVQAPAGGQSTSTPWEPEIPVTKGQ
jgi:hypothetical protein